MSLEKIKDLEYKLKACEIESETLMVLNDALQARVLEKEKVIKSLSEKVFQYEQVIDHFVDEHNLKYETRQ